MLQAEDGGILTQWTAAANVLSKHKMLYRAKAPPSAFLVHPMNRGSLGLNVHGMHRKGARILQVGVDPELLTRSVAWELSPDPAKRAAQVRFTESLAESCEEMLAQPSGAERYLTTSTSHTTQFFKALCAGCKTPEPFLASAGGRLSKAKWIAEDPKLSELLSDGWSGP